MGEILTNGTIPTGHFIQKKKIWKLTLHLLQKLSQKSTHSPVFTGLYARYKTIKLSEDNKEKIYVTLH